MSSPTPTPAPPAPLPAGHRPPALPLPGHLLESLRDFDLPRRPPGAPRVPAKAIAPPAPGSPQGPPSAAHARRLQVVKSPGGAHARCRWQRCREAATHYPWVSVWAAGKLRGSHGPLRVVPELPLCHRHARNPGWLTLTLQKQIAGSIMSGGFEAPDFKRAVLGCTSIRTGEHPHTRDPRD